MTSDKWRILARVTLAAFVAVIMGVGLLNSLGGFSPSSGSSPAADTGLTAAEIDQASEAAISKSFAQSAAVLAKERDDMRKLDVCWRQHNKPLWCERFLAE